MTSPFQNDADQDPTPREELVEQERLDTEPLDAAPGGDPVAADAGQPASDPRDLDDRHHTEAVTDEPETEHDERHMSVAELDAQAAAAGEALRRGDAKAASLVNNAQNDGFLG